MCGRFVLASLSSELGVAFDVPTPKVKPRFNVCPGQMVAALVHERRNRPPEFQALEWGLIPAWVRKGVRFRGLINARAETLAEKPSFRGAFRHRRCLVPADGFYEWRREKRESRPFFFRTCDPDAGMVFAGIWEDWTDGVELRRTMAIITTGADAAMLPYHDRMPLILPRERWREWLAPERCDGDLMELIRRPGPSRLIASEVTDDSIFDRLRP